MSVLVRSAASSRPAAEPVRPCAWLLVHLFMAHVATGQTWSPLGGGVDGPVYSLAVYRGDLYAGGAFSTAGGVPAPGVARWDGGEWSPVGAGMDGPVFTLLEFDGRLYAGGDFTSCGGSSCSNVAAWDDNGWVPVGSGLNGPVYAIMAYLGQLYVGGAFTASDSRSVNRIAVLDGGQWRQVSDGFNAPVHALAVTDAPDLFADLYAGGSFSQQDLSRIAWFHPAYQTWLATTWSGFNAPVFAFANYPGGLVAGGAFTVNGAGSSLSRLARRGLDFNGGANGDVRALMAAEGVLYVGGLFTGVGPAGAVRASNIARWSGVAWEALGSGTNDTVRALAMFRGEIYAAGTFDSAGTVRVGRVARWGPTSAIGPASPGIPARVSLLQNYPNPFNPTTTIRFDLPVSSRVLLRVFDTSGRLASVLADGWHEAGRHAVMMDASSMASGVYLYTLEACGSVQARQLVVLR